MAEYLCEECCNFVYDEDYEDYLCMANLDEDEFYRLHESNYKECPYFNKYDEYGIVRKQN